MTLQTKLPGSAIQTGTISVTAITNFSGELSASLPSDVVSSSAQVKTFLPTDTVSSSAQVTAFLPAGTVSSSGQLPAGIASSSAQVIEYLPTNVVSSSGQVTAFLPTGTVSSSTQVDVFTTTGGNTLATTGSNTFTAAQTISDTTNSTSYLDGALHVAGGMSVRKDVRVSGSMTINGLLTAVSMSTQYVTSSQYNIGVSRITLNDDDNVRFAGISIIDSGSASPTSASIFWDSLQHRFIYENLSGSAYNSSIIIAGPKHTGSLGDEPTLTSGYIAYATGGDHIDNSIIFQTGNNIGIGTTSLFGKLNIADSINGRMEFTPTSTGVAVEVLTSDRTNASDINFYGEDITFNTKPSGGYTERLRINSSGLVGIGTTNPSYLLDVQKSDAGNVVDFRITNTESANAASGTRGIIATNGASAGDPRLVLSVTAVREYCIGIDNSDSDKFKINDGSNPSSGTNYLTIDTSGNVGIGITNPANKLQIGSVGASGYAGNDLVIGNGTEVMAFYHYSGGPSTWFTNTNFALLRSGAGSTGSLGIGTSSPEARLDIIGATQGTITTLGSEVPGLIVQQRLTSDSNGNAGPMIDFRTSNGADVWTQGAIATIAAGTYAGQMAFYTQPGGTTDTTGRRTKGASLVERMRINESGNIGIGTTNPSGTGTTLEIKGVTDDATVKVTGNTAGNAYLQLNAGSSANAYINSVGSGYLAIGANGAASNAMTILSSGNVGIGTTNPANLLHVKASGNYGTIISDNSTNQGGGAFGVRKNGSAIGYLLNKGSWYGDTTNDLCVAAESGFNFRIYTDGSATEKFIFTTSGNLGIGTTDPSSFKLQVAGNVGPNANGTYDLGSTSLRWSTVYTSDLSLSNGIGDWTIVEGEDDLFIYNNKNNKVYKFTLQEVDPSTATPKKS